MIKLIRDCLHCIVGCLAVLVAVFVVAMVMSLYTIVRMFWWLFTLPQRVMGAKWSR